MAPADTSEFTNCSIQISKLSSEVFEKHTDKRKKKHNGRNRHLLMVKLGSYADSDGSSCYPSLDSLAADTGWSTRQVSRYLSDLNEMGFVVNEGYQCENGPRKRKLMLPEGATFREQERHIEMSSGKTHRKAGKTDRAEQERHIGEQERHLDVSLPVTRHIDQKEDQRPQAAFVPPSLPTRFDFASDWDIPAEIFLEVWPCPNTTEEAYAWLDHCRMRLGDALCSRNHWIARKMELLKDPESYSEHTLPELDERIISTVEACSEYEQIVQDAIQEFEDAGYSMPDYHSASNLRLFSNRQVFDSGHSY